MRYNIIIHKGENPVTTVEINYEMAKLRDERQQLLNRANVIGDCIKELASLRRRQQMECRYQDTPLFEEMFGG